MTVTPQDVRLSSVIGWLQVAINAGLGREHFWTRRRGAAIACAQNQAAAYLEALKPGRPACPHGAPARWACFPCSEQDAYFQRAQ